MKTLIIALVVGVAGVAGAYEKPGNPDRYMSFGIDIFKGQEAGMVRADGGTNGGTTGGKLDIRLPISSNLTLSAFGENTGINNNKDFTEGYKIGIGLRVYVKD